MTASGATSGGAALGTGSGATLAEGLAALEARYAEHAPALAGAGDDLLLTALAEGDGVPDPAALRQRLAPRLRPLLDAAAELDELAVSRAASGRLGGAERPADAGDEDVGAWPELPPADAVAAALDLPAGTPLQVRDASVARLTITRVLQTASEPVRWVPGEAPPLATYDGDPHGMVGRDHGWTDARWEGIRAGTVERVACSGCEGSGRERCAQCGGAGLQPCPELERCSLCHGSGKRPRAGRELLRGPCAACNGRGSLPCPLCGGQGRRPCQACAGGTVTCARCQGAGRVTRYQHGVVERKAEITVRVDAEALKRLGRGADRHFRPLARLTGDPTGRLSTVRLPERSPGHGGWSVRGWDADVEPFAGTPRAAGERLEGRPAAVPGAPEAVLGQIRDALEPVSADQVRQQVQADVLPAVAATYPHRGQERTDYLLGEDPDLRKRKLVRGGRRRGPRARR